MRFNPAVRRPPVTASAVSQRIKTLEESVGQVLVRRASPVPGDQVGAGSAGQGGGLPGGPQARFDRSVNAADPAAGDVGGGEDDPPVRFL